MPPSPGMRCSPGREQRVEVTHKRGRSLEGGLMLRAKDDDLVLFNEMENRERDSFLLLHSSDDVEESLSKLRCPSDFKLGITIPARGESSDLLNADGEKNDYDWLLTPPDTPLFPSLDDEEEPQPQNLSHRGRLRSQPINISKSPSLNERTHKNSRSSASPHRLSPSPRFGSNFGQLKPRPSSAPPSSPLPALCPVTPSRRPSTPPNKPVTPTPRSSTPALRRLSTGSSAQASSSGRRGTSPMRASRGNSASPKIRAWQSNIPGFSSDVPPNLRTSVSDQPSPHVRGLSPTPRSGRGRQSMSPTPSRSASSSHCNERDVFSIYSKGSVVSSGDDDGDSLHSTAISSSPPARRNGVTMNSRPMALSKKPSRTSLSSSAPKRSFESVLRQMDNRKTPQNMFRPLLSSVPATTFYVGKANNIHRPVFSRNSSLTTSTSASSDQGASVAPDMGSSEHGEWERRQHLGTQEDMFLLDKVDDVIEDSGTVLDEHVSANVDADDFNGSMDNLGVIASIEVAAESCVVDGYEIMVICSKCGKHFHLLGMDGNTDDCQECAEIDGLFAVEEPMLPPTVQTEAVIEKDKSVSELQLSSRVLQFAERCSSEVVPGQLEHEDSQIDFHHSDQQLESQNDETSCHCDTGSKYEEIGPATHPSHRMDNPEGTGISVLLLQRSSSSKWPIVQARAFSTTNILCSEPSYVRDNASSLRQSIERDIASASSSSSMDLGSPRKAEVHIQHQFSSRRSDLDSVRSDTDAKSQCTGSHVDVTVDASGPFVHPKSDVEENISSYGKGDENEALQEPNLVIEECSSSTENIDTSATNFTSCKKKDFIDGHVRVNADSCFEETKSESELLRHSTNFETSAADNLKDGDLPSCIKVDEDLSRISEWTSRDMEASNSTPGPSIITEEGMLNGPASLSNLSEAAKNSSSISLMESQNDCDNNGETFHTCSVPMVPVPEKSVLLSTSEPGFSDHVHCMEEESTVIVEGPGGNMSRSLTLAEATDTILFCSSIIHDIAYKAATIGMEKELSIEQDASRPTVTILGKSDSDQKDSRKIPNRRSPKSQKFKKKKLESQTKSPLMESGNRTVNQESTPLVNDEKITNKAPDSAKPPKLESKCNCTVM